MARMYLMVTFKRYLEFKPYIAFVAVQVFEKKMLIFFHLGANKMELDDIFLTACFQIYRQKCHWNDMLAKTTNGLKKEPNNSHPEGTHIKFCFTC